MVCGFDELDAVDDERTQDFLFVGAGEEILVVVVEQGGLLALAEGRVDDLERARAVLAEMERVRHGE